MDVYTERLSKVRKIIKKLDALLIIKAEDIFYLTGFSGGFSGARAVLVVFPRVATLLTDFRYFEQAKREVTSSRVKLWKRADLSELSTLLRKRKVEVVGFSSEHISLKYFRQLKASLKGVRLKSIASPVEALRTVKTKRELRYIQKAAKLTDKAFLHVLPMVRPGVSEIDLALELEFFMRHSGADKVGFDIIVASGWRSAMPHAQTSARKLKKGDLVIFDLGAVCSGYHSDMTRTVVLGKASLKQKKIYSIVSQAQRMVLERIRPGQKAGEVDFLARKVIKEAGYDGRFGHNLGHGVGLEIHEAPILSQGSKQQLQPGMVVTIEPGIYLPRFGGVRVEDLIVLSPQGAKVLTCFTKELLEI